MSHFSIIVRDSESGEGGDRGLQHAANDPGLEAILGCRIHSGAICLTFRLEGSYPIRGSRVPETRRVPGRVGHAFEILTSGTGRVGLHDIYHNSLQESSGNVYWQ